jgi:predicted lipoprotein with Yx(FWY)xxD motif
MTTTRDDMARDNQRQATSYRRRGTSPRSMRRHPRAFVLSALAAASAAGLLAACSSGSGTASAGGSGAVSGGSTLAAHQLSGVGTVLVDQSGKTVYTPDQETSSMIRCTGSCLSFWTPVTVNSAASASSAPQGFSGVMGTVKRPDDGAMQVTYNGKPLYTFRLDGGPGQAKGNNFQDSFNGTSFTWRAVSTTGTSGSGGTAPSPSGTSGYGGTGGY